MRRSDSIRLKVRIALALHSPEPIELLKYKPGDYILADAVIAHAIAAGEVIQRDSAATFYQVYGRLTCLYWLW